MSRARETAQALEPSIVWNVTKATPKTRPKDVEVRRTATIPTDATIVVIYLLACLEIEYIASNKNSGPCAGLEPSLKEIHSIQERPS